MCTWLSSPCSGASPEGWQFWQRGETKTVQARLNAACAAAASDLYAPPLAADATSAVCIEFEEVASAVCCCASVGKHAAKIAEAKSAIKAGHFLFAILFMLAPSPRTLMRNANLPV